MNMITTPMLALLNITKAYTMEGPQTRMTSNRLLLWKLMRNLIIKMKAQCEVEGNKCRIGMLIAEVGFHLHPNRIRTCSNNCNNKQTWTTQSMCTGVGSKIWGQATHWRSHWHSRRWMLKWNRNKGITMETNYRIQLEQEMEAVNHGKKTKELILGVENISKQKMK